MREIALHVLDLMENSISAGARQVVVRVMQDRRRDLLEVTIEDDGCGLGSDPEQALSPFFTTKESKHTGLGLSLVREAAERAGGSVTLSHSPLGGASVRIRMRLQHVDRMPLGDLPATVSALAATSPGVNITCEIEVDGAKNAVSTRQLRRPSRPNESGLAIMKRLSGQVRMSLEGLGAVP